MKPFSDRDYTRDAVIKQLGLVELHCRDGSAIDAGCQCIDTKHLFLIEGLCEEGQGFALSAAERQFYKDLGDLVRLIRKKMEVEDYNLHGVMRAVMGKKTDPLQRKILQCVKAGGSAEACTKKFLAG